MLKEYSISDILDLPPSHKSYYAGTFEGTEDPEIEWPHRHTFYSLVWFTQGSGFYVVDFQEYEIKANRIFFVSPKQIHNWDYSENSKGYILMYDSTLEQILNLEQIPSYLDLNDKHSFLDNIFINLIDEYNLQDKLSEENLPIAISYLYTQLKRFIYNNQINLRSSLHPKLYLFKQLVQAEPNLTKIKDYSKKLKLSEEDLATICKKSTGMSTKQFIIDIKITEAKRLLIYSNLNINEISFMLGFEDSSYFSRIFKKKTNISPSYFLEKYRKNK